MPLKSTGWTWRSAGRPSDGITMKRARVHARPARRKLFDAIEVLPLRGRRCVAIVVAAVCLGLCASQSAMIQFRALAGPVLKHGPRSLACVRVIEITFKLKGATKVKACARRALREDGAGSRPALALPRRLVSNQ